MAQLGIAAAFAVEKHGACRAGGRFRGRRALGSLFDDVPGIGPARRAALLKRFGSIRAMREASVEDIAAVPLMSPALAESLKGALAREGRLA